MSSILKAEDVAFYYGSNCIFEKVRLQVEAGDFVGIVGPNGSGKSTFLKICLGLIKPTKGSVKLFDTDISRYRDWAQVGYISQRATSFNQAFPATVEEVVAANLSAQAGFGGRLKGPHKDKVDEALEVVGMKDYKKRLVGKMSGGQQQRVFIAKALVSDPSIIFMDEPTVGIDRKSEDSFYELMEYLNKSKKITLVMVTHDIGAISTKVNRIVCIADGRMFEHQAGSGHLNEVFEEIYGSNRSIPVIHNH